MKFFIDTEFIAAKEVLQLISIGVHCRDTGKSFYAECTDYDVSLFSQWHYDNVMPGLEFLEETNTELCIEDGDITKVNGNYSFIGSCLKEWIDDITKPVSSVPEFWGYFCSTDWVLFCWLFGDSLMDIPYPWPLYCKDILQDMDVTGNYEIPDKTGRNHNALDDAIWHMEIYNKNCGS